MLRLALLAALILAPILPAQFVITPRVWIDPSVRMRLNKDWSDSAGQHERAYCVWFHTGKRPEVGNDEYTVYAVERAKESNTTPMSMDEPICPEGKNITLLHTHPPHTNVDHIYGRDPNREENVYMRDGIEAYQCWPSDADYTELLFESKKPFELIMCAPNAIAVYFRKPYRVIKP